MIGHAAVKIAHIRSTGRPEIQRPVIAHAEPRDVSEFRELDFTFRDLIHHGKPICIGGIIVYTRLIKEAAVIEDVQSVSLLGLIHLDGGNGKRLIRLGRQHHRRGQGSILARNHAALDGEGSPNFRGRVGLCRECLDNRAAAICIGIHHHHDSEGIVPIA